MRRLGAEFFCVLFIALFIMFFQLGSYPLLDPDEPVYAQTPREMLAAGDLLSPRIYGDFWYDKPPMYYWLVAAAAKTFGMGEFAARFPSALFAVTGALFLFFSISRLFNVRVAFFSSLVLATSLEYFYLGKAAVTDMTLNLCLMISLLSFLEKRYLLFYLFSALAVVTKGPIGLFFPAVIAFLYLLLMNRWRELPKMSILPGVLLFAVVAAPWYLLMTYYHGSAFVETFLGFHNVTRFTSPEHASGAVWYYFIPVLLVGFFPWTPILFQSLWTALTSNSRERPLLLFFIVWAAVVFLFFSISATKLVSYILPMFPAIAVVAGWYIDQMIEKGRSKPRVAATLITLMLGSALIFGLFKALDTMPYLEAGVLGCSAVILGMTVLSAVFYWSRSTGKAVAVQVIGMAMFVTVVTGLLMPALSPHFSSRELAAEFLRNYDGTSTMHIQKFLQPGIAFYAEKFGPEFKTVDQLSALLRRGETGYVLVQRKMYEKLPPQDRQKLVEVAATADKLMMRIR